MANSIEKLVKKNNENFPVASILIPKRYRSAIFAFYEFARHADDIADSSTFSAPEKLARLEEIKQGLYDGNLPHWAKDYYALTQASSDLRQHGLDLLEAFILDVTKDRYATWAELLEYCKYSAAPVGRYVLAVAGEDKADIAASDAICNALQIINHIQDLGEDYQRINRVYMPLEYLPEAHLEDLAANRESVELRRAIDLLLSQLDELLWEGRGLFKTVKSWRLKIELRIIYNFARRLAVKLRCEDVLRTKVRLSWWEKLLYG